MSLLPLSSPCAPPVLPTLRPLLPLLLPSLRSPFHAPCPLTPHPRHAAPGGAFPQLRVHAAPADAALPPPSLLQVQGPGRCDWGALTRQRLTRNRIPRGCTSATEEQNVGWRKSQICDFKNKTLLYFYLILIFPLGNSIPLGTEHWLLSPVGASLSSQETLTQRACVRPAAHTPPRASAPRTDSL